jgi:hypothetical protein
MKLIPLGYHCNITYLTKELGIRQETGLFEWFESKRLQYITDVINSIKNGIDTDIIQGEDYYIWLLNEYLYSYHYTLEDYKGIFQRRAQRFLDTIRNSTELLFARIQTHLAEDTTAEEIEAFCEAIHSINPNLSITFLLVDTIFKGDELPRLGHTSCKLIERLFFYEDCQADVYLRNNPNIRNTFYRFLIDAGYTP